MEPFPITSPIAEMMKMYYLMEQWREDLRRSISPTPQEWWEWRLEQERNSRQQQT